MNTIDWKQAYAAIWRSRQQQLRAVTSLDTVKLDDLLGIDHQKRQVIANTERFIQGLPANHVLLWGARGTGKSSVMKALLNRFAKDNLRVIEVDKDDLIYLPDIVDNLRDQPFRFIVYCDDLSFEPQETQYKHLKSVLEGSIELPPENILIYATSNRRHLIPESMTDNLNSSVIDGELHYADAIEEKISLADRFGLRLSFHPISQQAYLEIVNHLFRDHDIDRQQLEREALLFSRTRGSRSGRTARQFYNSCTPRLNR